MTYAQKLKDPQWQQKRLEVFKRDGFQCVICDRKDQELHVHHIEYAKNPWDVPSNSLVTLCADHHKDVEVLKLKMNKLMATSLGFVIVKELTTLSENQGHETIANVVTELSQNQQFYQKVFDLYENETLHRECEGFGE